MNHPARFAKMQTTCTVLLGSLCKRRLAPSTSLSDNTCTRQASEIGLDQLDCRVQWTLLLKKQGLHPRMLPLPRSLPTQQSQACLHVFMIVIQMYVLQDTCIVMIDQSNIPTMNKGGNKWLTAEMTRGWSRSGHHVTKEGRPVSRLMQPQGRDWSTALIFSAWVCSRMLFLFVTCESTSNLHVLGIPCRRQSLERQ